MDTNDHVTARELNRAVETLEKTMAAGFAGINNRLDKLNGRTDKNESVVGNLRSHVAELGAKITNLNREVFDRGHRNPTTDPDQKPLTRRDLTVAIAAGTVVVGILIWLFNTFGANTQTAIGVVK